MCGRFTLTTDYDTLEERFALKGGMQLPLMPRYNVAPTQEVLSVVNDGQRNVGEMMRWGLIPSWAKDPSIGNRMINARAETLTTRPSFRTAFKKRRCLIPADSFYEWRRLNGSRRPMRIMLKSGEPFAFAGLYETWKDPQGQSVRSCTIITTDSNTLIQPIHDRMPVILPRDAEAAWLDPVFEDTGALLELLVPYPSEEMTAYEVSKLVNSPRNESPEVIVPAQSG
jgi:putative SOS response-associated peptidase YedK